MYQERVKVRKCNMVAIVYLLFVCVFLSVFFSANTNADDAPDAYSCGSFLNGSSKWPDGSTLRTKNLSLYNACYWQNQNGGIYGALWLNGNKYPDALSSDVAINRNEGKKAIYLHGLQIGTNLDDTAHHVKVVRGNKYMADNNCENDTCRVEYVSADEWAHPSLSDRLKNYPEYWSYGAITGWENTNYQVWRPGFNYNQYIASTGVLGGLTLNVATFKKLENGLYLDKNKYGGSVTYGAEKDTYKVPLQVFRCNGSVALDTVKKGACYSDTSWVTVDLPKSRYAGAAMAVDTTNNSLDWTKREQSGGWAAYTKLWPGANEGDQKTYYDIGDCPDSGCDFGFRFFLKGYNYGPTTKFRIFETDSENNLRKIVKKSWDAEPKYFDLTDGNGGPDYGGKQVYSFTGNVKPGQIKCGTIEYDTSDDHSANSSTRLATVCVRANAQQPGFQGRSNVWDEDHTTGWFGAGNKTETYYINDCATTGCDVALSHYLKRSSGSGTTQYDDVTKKTNGWSREPEKSEYDEEGVTDSSLSREKGALILRDTYTLYPGEKICETLNFSSKGDGNKDGHSTVCAVALGETGSDIDMKVMNSSLANRNSQSQYSQYNDETLIKPTDSVKFRATYSALNGNVANLKPDAVKIDGGENNDNSGENKTLKELFNERVNPGWQKAFVAFGSDDVNAGISYSTFVGDGAKIKTESTNGFKAGKTYTRTAKTNPRDVKNNNVVYNNVWTTPESVIFSNDDGNLVADVSTGSKSDSAYVKVPYNFKTGICILDSENKCQKNGEFVPVVYAGESTSVSYKVSVVEKSNDMLADTYATNVDHAKIRVFVCYSGQCSEVNSARRDDASFDKGDSVGTVDGVQIPDLPAGTDVTIRTMVYPKQSYKDDAMEESDWGNECRAIIDECWETSSVTYKVAKRPSFQVWGGSVSANKINAKSTKKTTIDGYSGEARTFGSWAELTIASNSNDDMASGAGFGYSRPELFVTDDAPGGNSDGEYNNLTFNGGDNETITLEDIKTSLEKDGYKTDDENKKLLYADGTYIISNDIIRYDEGMSYNDFESIPSIVILAKNIDIKCDVGRIDAILIAKDNINTCSDGGTLQTSRAAQNQLIINGAIKTGGKLSLNRTYGAATGRNSIVPAEIINYDNSMMFIGGGSASASASVDPSKLEVQHIRELAPRY